MFGKYQLPADYAAMLTNWAWLVPIGALVAGGYALARWYSVSPEARHTLRGRTTRGHLLDGVTLFPMSMLVIAPLFPGLGAALLKYDGAVLSIASLIAILSVVDSEPARKPRAPYVRAPRAKRGAANAQTTKGLPRVPAQPPSPQETGPH